jgi:exodeoxyribonuclease III
MGWEPADREGRVITVSVGNLRVMGAYVFNGGKSEDAFSDKLEFWDRIRDIHAGWAGQGLDVAFLGDYNICHTPIDIADPVGNKDAVGFRPVERDKLSGYFEAGFADCFRRQHPGLAAQYTWWSNRPGVRARNHGWRIDYATVSENLWPRVVRCWHEPDQMGSDHCPIGLELR